MRSVSVTRFRAAAVLLVGTWVLSLVFVSIESPGRHGVFVRLGTTGFVVVTLAWAASASTPAKTIARAASFTVIALFAEIAANVASLVLRHYTIAIHGRWIYGTPPSAPVSGSGGFLPANPYSLLLPSLLTLAGIVVLFVVLAVVARSSVTADRRWLRGLTAGALVAVLVVGMVGDLRDGAIASAIVSVSSAGWLLWALRRARQGRTGEVLAAAT